MSKRCTALEVLSIPELLDIMQASLTPYDLAQCVLVSSEFRTLFTPLLWHTVSLTTLEQHNHFTTSPQVQKALIRNARFVRVIRVWTAKSLRPFMDVKAEELCYLNSLEFTWLRMQGGHATSLTETVARSAIRDTSNERVAWSLGRRVTKRQHTFSLNLGAREATLRELYQARAKVEDGPSQTAKDRYLHRTRLLRLQKKEARPPVVPIWLRNEIVPPPSDPRPYELYEDPKDDQLLILFLSYFQELKIFMSTSLVFFNPAVLKSFGTRLGMLRYLSLTLDDVGHKNRYATLTNLLDKEYPHLERLRLMFSNTGWTTLVHSNDQGESDAVTSSSLSESKVAGPPILSMKSLMIEDNVHFYTDTDTRKPPQPWLFFLRRCINLTSLSLSSIPSAVLIEVAGIVSECCPLLDDLAIGCVSSAQSWMNHRPTDNNIASLLAACSPRSDDEATCSTLALPPILRFTSSKRTTGLKQLRLYGVPFHDQDYAPDSDPFARNNITPFRALSRHMHCLTHLDFDSMMEYDNGELFLRIVQKFPKLEMMNALPYARMKAHRNKGWVDAGLWIASVTSGEWACMETLRVLKVNINGFTSSASISVSAAAPAMPVTGTPVDLDSTNNNQDSDTEPVSDSQAESLSDLMRTSTINTLQHQVCQHLNLLTSLRELCLGVQPTDELEYCRVLTGVQEDCLELSLDSGLNRMEDLKELRVLSVMRMKHKIRLEEVKWMVAHWPKLDAIPGLLSSAAYNDTDEEWEALQDEEQDIVHWIKENKPLLKYAVVTAPKGSLEDQSRPR
ncbi:hypothetical protein EC957_004495 [Mortierella hygrophila]|uniref:F-box domain-containing protein n=1 Tax=Mortierella hygrophila TaxID=979708 RepID=A0A9P6K6Y7_9FUNG|nr:hypothetical protein EC957_004495 [Mortierella hygrophila]